MDMSNEVVVQMLNWNMSLQTIHEFLYCGIHKIEILKLMHMKDIDEIYATLPRTLLGEKIMFRHKLQKWLVQNKIPLLSCYGSDQTLVNSIQTPVINSWENVNRIKEITHDVKSILSTTAVGLHILKSYENRKTLTDSDRNNVVRIIIDHLLSKQIIVNANTMAAVAQEILSIFPNEIESTYYISCNSKKKPSGKLYDRYFNQKRRFKSLNVGKCGKKQKIEEQPNSKEISSSPENADFEENKNWLIYNIPSNLKTIWQQTSKQRLIENKNSINVFLNDWPRYKDANGFELIDIDFNTIFPGKNNSLVEKINAMEKNVSDIYFPDHIKDKFQLQYFIKYKSTDNSNALHFYFLNLLHAILPPLRLSRMEKPSISEAQKDMIVHIKKINDWNTEALEENGRLPPKVLVVGEDVEKLEEFYVIFGDVRYKVPTLLRAVDLVIKLCYVMNLNYSKKSKLVWLFLANYIYDIPSSHKISKLETLLNKLPKI